MNVIREYDSLVGDHRQPIPDDLEYLKSFNNLSQKWSPGKQSLPGGCPRIDARNGYFVFYQQRGHPNAILEAMAAKPVIATRTGGIPDLIKDEENGILVTPGDAKEFEAALRKLLSDTRLAGQMGQSGQHRVQEYYNCHNISSQLIRLYQSLLQQ